MSVSDPSIWISITLVSSPYLRLIFGVEMAFVTSDRVRVELDVNKGGFIGRTINRFYSNLNCLSLQSLWETMLCL